MQPKFEIMSTQIVESKDGVKKHVTYTIRVRRYDNDRDPGPVVVERRYSDFFQLYESLSADFPEIKTHIYFPKKVLIGNFAPEVIKIRSKCFEIFLKAIAMHEKFRESPKVKKFLVEKEEKKAKQLMEAKYFGQAKPILENTFRLLNKIYTDRHPWVMIALCRLTACCNADPFSLNDAEIYAALALRRFEGISDVDLLCYYVPLLQLCVQLWLAFGRDPEYFESRINTLKRNGHRVEGVPTLLESMLKID